MKQKLSDWQVSFYRRIIGMEKTTEQKELDVWLAEHPEEACLLKQMTDGKEFKRREERIRTLSIENEFQRVLKKRKKNRYSEFEYCFLITRPGGRYGYFQYQRFSG